MSPPPGALDATTNGAPATTSTVAKSDALRARWLRMGAALLALLFLNGLLSFGPWWPTPGIVPQARLAPEGVALWLLLLWLAARPRAPTPTETAAVAAHPSTG